MIKILRQYRLGNDGIANRYWEPGTETWVRLSFKNIWEQIANKEEKKNHNEGRIKL